MKTSYSLLTEPICCIIWLSMLSLVGDLGSYRLLTLCIFAESCLIHFGGYFRIFVDTNQEPFDYEAWFVLCGILVPNTRTLRLGYSYACTSDTTGVAVVGVAKSKQMILQSCV
ncbi:hypothetical protein F4821DRAFT_248781 [Hypoxylon rubiginosum]|uniref:Uncharacterized protein n=1 Tax=Hypoxylon rubiginosum TaxID=110542 RepID=A0ACC0CMK1_9PEZI|nr:hypothetical protein F4821DRAFT_248781 [Hypoxylon rubiginosum]